MSPTAIGAAVFACTLVGALLGQGLRWRLPEHHLDSESKDTVKLGIGLIATMTALVLGLVTASAKNSFDAVNTAVRHTAMDLLTLDRLLDRYGPETAEIRGRLKHSLERRVETLWPTSRSRSAELDPTVSGSASQMDELVNSIYSLSPRDDLQRSLRSRAIDLAESLLQTRWLATAGIGTSVPPLFLVVLVFWLTITFASFGLFAPRNSTVAAVLFVCSVSVACAVFLILEMDGPFDGVLRVSAEPLRLTLAHLGQ